MGYKEQIKTIINQWGTTVKITPITFDRDDRGDEYPVEGTVVITKGVMDSFFSDFVNYQQYGNTNSTEPILVLAYDEVIKEEYYIEFQGKHYSVINVQDFYLSDVNLAYQCRLKERD